MLRATLLLVVIALSCHAVPESDDDAVNQIYSDVIHGDYNSAITLTKDLENSGRGGVVSQALDKLLTEGQRNVMDYAYQVWQQSGTDSIKNYFPFQIRNILGAVSVKIIGLRDYMVLKLGSNVDRNGDRIAYGDSDHKIGERMAWRINPVSDPFSEKLHFYIYNILNNQFLKLGASTDRDGDHAAYGDSSHDGHRKQWYLIPLKQNGTVFFYIFNREYNQALKLSRAVDSYGDRRVFSEHDNVIGNINTFGWIIAGI